MEEETTNQPTKIAQDDDIFTRIEADTNAAKEAEGNEIEKN